MHLHTKNMTTQYENIKKYYNDQIDQHNKKLKEINDEYVKKIKDGIKPEEIPKAAEKYVKLKKQHESHRYDTENYLYKINDLLYAVWFYKHPQSDEFFPTKENIDYVDKLLPKGFFQYYISGAHGCYNTKLYVEMYFELLTKWTYFFNKYNANIEETIKDKEGLETATKLMQNLAIFRNYYQY